MRRGRKLGVALLLLAAAPVAGWQLLFPTYTYRYRLTVNVASGDEHFSGSSVIEIRLTKQPQFPLPVPSALAKVNGEAVFLDLGNGRNLIALLASIGSVDYAKYVVPKHFKLSYSDSNLPKYSKLEGRWELSGSELPALFTFTNINDVTTGHVIPAGDFANELGPNTRLINITVEMTKAPVTHGIEKNFSWWNQPFPWVERDRTGIGTDIRRNGFRWGKNMLKTEQ